MKDMAQDIERVGGVYEELREFFEGGFHNALWQLMVNRRGEGAFTTLSDGSLVVAHAEGGYTPCSCRFVPTTGPLARDVALERLNQAVFGLSQTEARDLSIASMFASAAS